MVDFNVKATKTIPNSQNAQKCHFTEIHKTDHTIIMKYQTQQ